MGENTELLPSKKQQQQIKKTNGFVQNNKNMQKKTLQLILKELMACLLHDNGRALH